MFALTSPSQHYSYGLNDLLMAIAEEHAIECKMSNKKEGKKERARHRLAASGASSKRLRRQGYLLAAFMIIKAQLLMTLFYILWLVFCWRTPWGMGVTNSMRMPLPCSHRHCAFSPLRDFPTSNSRSNDSGKSPNLKGRCRHCDSSLC